MHFLAYPFIPAAGAAGGASRVQLPAVGRSAFGSIALGDVKGLPVTAVATSPRWPHAGPARDRAHHRAQCWAACRSKANF
ncbi:hypothetical protein A8B98_06075 [Hymenobacter sp. UV11]|nr:hypothetical protein A8B98_06075 [Hymenobacter sp. UV11]